MCSSDLVGDRAEIRARRIRGGAELGGAREPGVTVAQSSSARTSGFPRMAATKTDVYFAWTVPGATREEPSGVRLARGRLAR